MGGDSLILLQSPFSILGTGPQLDAVSLSVAYDNALDDETIPEKQLLEARQALSVSKTRLDAEVSWLPGVPGTEIVEIILALRNGQASDLSEKLGQTPPLARANLAASIAAAGVPDFEVLTAIFAAQEEIDVAETAELINGDRRQSGFPQVSNELVAQALEGLRKRHVSAFVAGVASDSRPGLLATKVVEHFENAEGNVLNFLEQAFEAYDNWTLSALGEIHRRTWVAD